MEQMTSVEIKKLRKKKGLTQAQFGKKIWPQISNNTAQCRVRRLETQSGAINNSDLEKINAVFNIEGSMTRQFSHVCDIYPELEALITILYHAHPLSASPNFEMAKAGWSGFEVLSKQKVELYNSIIDKYGKAS